MSTPRCPECGGRVAYDLTCHTYGQGDRFYTCMPCDSAIEYLCTEWLDDDRPFDDPADCAWRYTHGLNPRNPRAADNEKNRPSWIPAGQGAQIRVRRGDYWYSDLWRVPGVPLLGDDGEAS